MKKTRMLTCILAAAMLIGVLAGCSDGGQTSNTTSAAAAASATAAATAAAAAASATAATAASAASATAAATAAATSGPAVSGDRIAFTYWSTNMGELEPESYTERLIEEKLGDVDVQTIKVPHSDSTAVDLMLASGDAPDCGWWWKDPDDLYYNQLLTRTIPMDMMAEHTPSYYTLITETVPYLSQIRIPRDGDASVRLSMPGYDSSVGYNMYYYSSFYRADWMEKFDIKPEGDVIEVSDQLSIASSGLSLDNLYTYLYKCVYEDPDGNGAADTIGISGWMNFNSFRMIAAAFGFQDCVINENGTAIQYYTSSAYREFLAFIQKLYADGLIDKELPTLDVNQYHEKGQLANAAYYNNTCNALGSWAATRPPLNVLSAGAGVRLMMAPSEVGTADCGKEGAEGTRVYNPYPNYNNFVVNARVGDGTLAAILRFFEVMNFDPEARLASTHGIEGRTYEMVDGKPIRIADADKSGIGVGAFAQFIQDSEFKKNNSDGLFLAVWDYVVGSDSLFCRKLVVPYMDDPFGQTKLTEYYSDGTIQGENIDQIVNEYFANALVGNSDLESDWDAYISNLNACGYQDMIEELNKGVVVTGIIGTNGK